MASLTVIDLVSSDSGCAEDDEGFAVLNEAPPKSENSLSGLAPAARKAARKLLELRETSGKTRGSRREIKKLV
eukprot:689135-Rhodomonas_salina.1